jgi:hypothetical protein
MFKVDNHAEYVTIGFEAKNSVGATQNKIYIFEGGSYTEIGKIALQNHWRYFEIKIKTNPGAILEFQIDGNQFQTMHIKNFKVGNSISFFDKSKLISNLSAYNKWDGGPYECENSGDIRKKNCIEWDLKLKKGYIMSPLLPITKSKLIGVEFKASIDASVRKPEIISLYLFEGSKYKIISQIPLDERWNTYRIVIDSNHKENKIYFENNNNNISRLKVADIKIFEIYN